MKKEQQQLSSECLRLTVLLFCFKRKTKLLLIMFAFLGCSRYDLAIDALHSVIPDHPTVSVKARTLISNYQHAIHQHEKYIEKNGTDPSELSEKPAF